MSFLAAIVLLSSAAVELPASEAEPDPKPLRGPIKMKASQIREYNKSLAKNHPAFIRCEGQAVTGSLAMRTKVCRTNKDWARVQQEGNDAARGMLDSLNIGSTNGDPPAGDVRPGLPGG